MGHESSNLQQQVLVSDKVRIKSFLRVDVFTPVLIKRVPFHWEVCWRGDISRTSTSVDILFLLPNNGEGE